MWFSTLQKIEFITLFDYFCGQYIFEVLLFLNITSAKYGRAYLGIQDHIVVNIILYKKY